MKKSIPRELIWMTLPITLFAGVAWWRSSHAPFSSVFDSATPLHVEFAPFEPVKLSPVELSRGHGWAAKTHVETVGSWKTPPGWKKSILGIADLPKSWLVYRRGKTWNVASPSPGEFLPVSGVFTLDGDETFFVDLRTIPRDAEEVRLRGKFKREQWYTGPLPRAWKPPQNLHVAGPNRWNEVDSTPFDVPIKAKS